MAVQVTTSFTDSNSNDAWQSLVNRRLLERGVYNHYCMMFTEKKPLSQRQGKTVMYRRYASHAKQTTALTEGVTPTPLSKSKTDVAITIAAYGAWMTNSDFLELTLPEGTADDVDQLSQNMGETMDLLYAIMWGTGTNITYSNGSSETDVVQLPVYEDFNKSIRSLQNNKAKRMTPVLMASQKIGSGSIMPGYWCLLSNSQFYDVRAGSTFKDRFRLPSDYGNFGAAMDGEGGALDIGLRFLPIPDDDITVSGAATGLVRLDAGGSTFDANVIASNGASSADVHLAVMIGRQAAGSVDLSVGNSGIIKTELGSGNSSDPLKQRSTIGWKTYDGRGVLNQAFFQTLKSAVTL